MGSVSGHRVEWTRMREITPHEIVVANTGGRKLRRRTTARTKK